MISIECHVTNGRVRGYTKRPCMPVRLMECMGACSSNTVGSFSDLTQSDYILYLEEYDDNMQLFRHVHVLSNYNFMVN